MRIKLLDTPIDVLSFQATIDRCEEAMASGNQCVHVAMNAAKFVKMRSNDELWNDVAGADIIGIDGIGVVFGLKLFGLKNVERVTGVDLMMAILAHCAKTGRRPYILGAKQEILDAAIVKANEKWPTLQMAGYRNGYFTIEEEDKIVTDIAISNADCLFIAMPTPNKERFLAKHAKALCTPYIMGVGGSVDVLAGHVSRAPLWMQKNGLEWFHRFMQEPRRMFWRYASTNGKFIGLLLSAKFKGETVTVVTD